MSGVPRGVTPDWLLAHNTERIADALERIAGALEVHQAANFWPQVHASDLRAGDRVYDPQANKIDSVLLVAPAGANHWSVELSDGRSIMCGLFSDFKREPVRP